MDADILLLGLAGVALLGLATLAMLAVVLIEIEAQGRRNPRPDRPGSGPPRSGPPGPGARPGAGRFRRRPARRTPVVPVRRPAMTPLVTVLTGLLPVLVLGAGILLERILSRGVA